MTKPIHGILTRIKLAASEAEIDALLNEGESYRWASDRTRNRWARKAKKRKEELGK